MKKNIVKRMPHYFALEAFSLVEMTIVISVISVLIGLALPRFTNTIERVHSNEGRQILNVILGAQQRHFLDNNVFAETIDDLDIDAPSNMSYFQTIEAADDMFDAGIHVGQITRIGDLYTLRIQEDGDITCINLGGTDFCTIIGL